MFAHKEVAAASLDETRAAPHRLFTIVAERAGAVVGFAVGMPWALPGIRGVRKNLDKTHMVLMYLAVDPDHRRRGIAKALVAEVENRARSARQNVLIAHIPEGEAGFYRRTDWEVAPAGHGYAWLPFMLHLRSDVGDPGYPLIAAKVLRPKAIRLTFTFPIDTGRPGHDSATRLMQMIDTGDVDERDLDSETKGLVDMARRGRPPQAILDLFGTTTGPPSAT